MVSVYAHELVETASNFIGAWYFDDGAVNIYGDPVQGDEVADVCLWNFGTDDNYNVVIGEKKFLVQKNWKPFFGCMTGL